MANLQKIQKEVESIKWLLVLLLEKLGSDSAEIAMATGDDDSTIRKVIKKKQVKKICLNKEK